MLIPKDKIIQFIKKSIKISPEYWRETEYHQNFTIFSQGETIEKLYFVKEGVLRISRIDKTSNEDHTAGFVLVDGFYLPLSALNNWCPAMAGIQAIGRKNIIMEIDIDDWLYRLGEDESLMRKYAISMGIWLMEDATQHFINNKANKRNMKKIYYELKQENNPIVTSGIDNSYLASHFQVNKRSLDKIEQDYIKEQKSKKK